MLRAVSFTSGFGIQASELERVAVLLPAILGGGGEGDGDGIADDRDDLGLGAGLRCRTELALGGVEFPRAVQVWVAGRCLA